MLVNKPPKNDFMEIYCRRSNQWLYCQDKVDIKQIHLGAQIIYHL
jgi:hypothetical protein